MKKIKVIAPRRGINPIPWQKKANHHGQPFVTNRNVDLFHPHAWEKPFKTIIMNHLIIYS